MFAKVIEWFKESWRVSPHNLIGLIGCSIGLFVYLIALVTLLSGCGFRVEIKNTPKPEPVKITVYKFYSPSGSEIICKKIQRNMIDTNVDLSNCDLGRNRVYHNVANFWIEEENE